MLPPLSLCTQLPWHCGLQMPSPVVKYVQVLSKTRQLSWRKHSLSLHAHGRRRGAAPVCGVAIAQRLLAGRHLVHPPRQRCQHLRPCSHCICSITCEAAQLPSSCSQPTIWPGMLRAQPIQPMHSPHTGKDHPGVLAQFCLYGRVTHRKARRQSVTPPGARPRRARPGRGPRAPCRAPPR